MTAQVVEKHEGRLLIEVTAETPLDAMPIAVCAVGVPSNLTTSGIDAHSNEVTLHIWLPVHELMKEKRVQ